MTFQSIIDILFVSVKAGNAKKTGLPYSITEAHCVLRNDDGTPGAVGVLAVPKFLESLITPDTRGYFTASFGLQAGTYGDTQGRIMAVLTGITPVPAAAVRRPVSSSSPMPVAA